MNYSLHTILVLSNNTNSNKIKCDLRHAYKTGWGGFAGPQLCTADISLLPSLGPFWADWWSGWSGCSLWYFHDHRTLLFSVFAIKDTFYSKWDKSELLCHFLIILLPVLKKSLLLLLYCLASKITALRYKFNQAPKHDDMFSLLRLNKCSLASNIN